MNAHDRGLSRRRFLGRLIGGGSAVAVGAELAACAATSSLGVAVSGGRISLDLTELKERMGEGNAIALTAPELAEPILLLRRDSGEFEAIGSRCTHLGCRVRPTGHVLSCPCHGSAFDLDGKVLRGPAQKPLSRYGVEMTAGHLIVSGVGR